jgi:hypothetical protein
MSYHNNVKIYIKTYFYCTSYILLEEEKKLI